MLFSAKNPFLKRYKTTSEYSRYGGLLFLCTYLLKLLTIVKWLNLENSFFAFFQIIHDSIFKLTYCAFNKFIRTLNYSKSIVCILTNIINILTVRSKILQKLLQSLTTTSDETIYKYICQIELTHKFGKMVTPPKHQV